MKKYENEVEEKVAEAMEKCTSESDILNKYLIELEYKIDERYLDLHKYWCMSNSKITELDWCSLETQIDSDADGLLLVVDIKLKYTTTDNQDNLTNHTYKKRFTTHDFDFSNVVDCLYEIDEIITKNEILEEDEYDRYRYESE